MWRPLDITPERLEAFLTDLRALYERHGLYIAAREPLYLCFATPGETDTARRAADEDNFDASAYIDVPTLDLEIDDIRNEAIGVRHYLRY